MLNILYLRMQPWAKEKFSAYNRVLSEIKPHK